MLFLSGLAQIRCIPTINTCIFQTMSMYMFFALLWNQ